VVGHYAAEVVDTVPAGVGLPSYGSDVSEGCFDAVRRSARARLREHGADLAAIGLSPFLIFWVLGVEPFFRQNLLDPFIYQGFGYRPNDLIARHGYAYYSVRFGVLWPIEASTALFGAAAGFLIMRWALAVAAGGMVYLLFRRHHGRWLALASLWLFLASPVLLRGLMTTYSDTTAVPYLTIAVGGLLCDPKRHRTACMAGVGLFFGLAIHSNPVLAPTAIVAVIAWMASRSRFGDVDSIRGQARSHVRDGLAMASAVIALTLVGMVAYQIRYGDWNILRPSVDAARRYSGDEGKVWRAPSAQWARYHLQLYVPLAAVVLWGLSLFRRPRPVARVELSAMSMLIAVYGYFMFNQFVQRGTILETYYYSSYLFPFTIFALGFALASLADHFGTRRVYLAGVPLAVLAVPYLRNHLWPGMEVPWMPWVPLFIVVLAIGAVSAYRDWRFALGTLVAFIVVVNVWWLGSPRVPGRGSIVDPTYEFALGNADWSGMDLYNLTYDLSAVAPPLQHEDGTTTLFWFPSTDPTLGTINGAFLAYASALQSTGVGMPTITPWHVARMREERVSSLVLMGADTGDLEAGLDSLHSMGVETRRVQRHTLQHGDLTVEVAVTSVVLPAV